MYVYFHLLDPHREEKLYKTRKYEWCCLCHG